MFVPLLENGICVFLVSWVGCLTLTRRQIGFLFVLFLLALLAFSLLLYCTIPWSAFVTIRFTATINEEYKITKYYLLAEQNLRVLCRNTLYLF